MAPLKRKHDMLLNHNTDRIISGVVDGYNHEGMGILRMDQGLAFVPGALTDEAIRARLSQRNKGQVYWADLLDVEKPSPHRVISACPYDAVCGGCQLAHATYAHQLDVKDAILSRALSSLSTASSPPPYDRYPILPAPSPFAYRNKGVFALTMDNSGSTVSMDNLGSTVSTDNPGSTLSMNYGVRIGFYARQSRKVAGHGCPLLFSPQVNALLDDIARWMQTSVMPDSENLSVHHLMVRESTSTGTLVLVLVGGSQPSWLGRFLHAFPIQTTTDPSVPYRLAGIAWLKGSANSGGTIIKGKPVLLGGKLESIEELSLFPYPRFSISPESFFQVNTAQTNTLISTVLDLCDLKGDEIVWDLYCGTGSISIPLACHALAVLGIDVSHTAIRDAWANTRLNRKISSPVLDQRLCFLAGPAEEICPSLGKAGSLQQIMRQQKKLHGLSIDPKKPLEAAPFTHLEGKAPQIVVLDPSAKGAKPAVLEAILRSLPEKIIYVSCDPSTLVRDLNILCATGVYRITKIQAIDLFPQTAHVETVVSLLRTSG